MNEIWSTTVSEAPLVAAAIHAGHEVRPEVRDVLFIDEPTRLREEDPYTDTWTFIAETRLVGLRSRFEVDLNRPRDRAVYLTPDDAWGLRVWRSEPPHDLISRSLAEYDTFYAEMKRMFDAMEERYKAFVVFDLHSFNHRRDGADGAVADPHLNPEVNIGTGSMNRQKWHQLVDRFIDELGSSESGSNGLDVRENVKFKGGYFSKWIHETYPESACCLAIEFKKTFMDEWSGGAVPGSLSAIASALESTVPGVYEELRNLGATW